MLKKDLRLFIALPLSIFTNNLKFTRKSLNPSRSFGEWG